MYFHASETFAKRNSSLSETIKIIDSYLANSQRQSNRIYLSNMLADLAIKKLVVERIIDMYIREGVLDEVKVYLCPHTNKNIQNLNPNTACEHCQNYHEIDELDIDLYYKILVTVQNDEGVEKLKNKIFVSYSHQDSKWLERLESMWAIVVRVGLISPWSDKMIRPSDDWRKEIDSALDQADVAVLLVSDNFFKSNFIMDEELPYILDAVGKKKMKVFWVAISSVPFQYSPLAPLQAGNDDPNKPLDLFYDKSDAQGKAELNKIVKNLVQMIEDNK